MKSEPEKYSEETREHSLDGEPLKTYRYAVAQQTKLHSVVGFESVLSEVDVLLTPTVPTTATEIGQRETNIGGYVEFIDLVLTRLTGPTSLNGFPSLSGPCGLTASGLPVGLQIIGHPFDEATVYRYGHAYEMVASLVPGAF